MNDEAGPYVKGIIQTQQETAHGIIYTLLGTAIIQTLSSFLNFPLHGASPCHHANQASSDSSFMMADRFPSPSLQSWE